jgi:hypothetical protein
MERAWLAGVFGGTEQEADETLAQRHPSSLVRPPSGPRQLPFSAYQEMIKNRPVSLPRSA